METTFAVPNSLTHRAGRAKGRTIGALICGGFGAAWMFQAIYLGGIAQPAPLAVIGAFSVFFVAAAIAQLYSFRNAPDSSDYQQYWPSVSKKYWTVVTVEGVACLVGANVANNIGRQDLVPEIIGLIVGLHFLPLAKIFRAPIYVWTAAGMTLGVLASFAIPAGELRNLVACGICGLTLWATEAAILWQYKH